MTRPTPNSPGRRLLLTLVVSSLLGGCGAQIAETEPRITIAPEQLAILPPSVDIFFIDEHLIVTHHLDRTRAAAANLADAFNEVLSSAGVRSFRGPALDSIQGYDDFIKWTKRVITDVYDDAVGQNSDHPAHPGVYVWRYPGSLAPLRASLRADFALVSQFLEGDNARHMNLRRPFDGERLAARRQAAACVVDLRSGQLVWCETDQMIWLLDERRLAKESVKRLTKHLVLVPGAASPPVGVSTAPPIPSAAAPASPVLQAVDPETSDQQGDQR